MGKMFLGAISNSNKETRILKLKAYLDSAKTYRSDTALTKAEITSWTTLLSYLNVIKKQYPLTELGKTNLQIAFREAEFLEAANKKAKRLRH